MSGMQSDFDNLQWWLNKSSMVTIYKDQHSNPTQIYMSQQFPAFRFEPPTSFVKSILIGSVSLYLAEQILMGWMNIPLAQWVAWNPTETFTQPWSWITQYLFLHDTPIGFLFKMLAIYFFLPVVIDGYGKKGLNRLLLWLAIITSTVGVLGVVTGAVPSTSPSAFGIYPLIVSLVAIFGLKNPFATIYIIVFPVQASWVAWGSGILATLNFFAGRSLESLLVIGGWITGYLFVNGRGHIRPQRLWKKYTSQAKHKKRHRQLQAMDGGKSDKYEH